MEKNKVTYEEIGIFLKTATGYLNSHPEVNTLSASLERMITVLTPKDKAANSAFLMQRIRLAIKEPGGHKAVIVKDGQYQYTEENLLALEEFSIAQAAKCAMIKPIYVDEADLPVPFAYSWRSAFEKFVIRAKVHEEDNYVVEDVEDHPMHPSMVLEKAAKDIVAAQNGKTEN